MPYQRRLEIVEKIRSLVRPILSITGWGVLLYLAIVADGTIRAMFVGAMTTIIGYWFGERSTRGGK